MPKASDWLNEVSREAARVGVFVRRFRRFSCRGHLTQTEGRDDAAEAGEGRLARAVPVKADGATATFKPRRRRGVPSGVAARQMRRGFVVRAGRRRASAKHTYAPIYAQCSNADTLPCYRINRSVHSKLPKILCRQSVGDTQMV